LLSLVVATILSCFFFLGQEFFRRLHIAKLDLKETLINDLVTHSLRLGGLLLLLYTGNLSTVPSLVVICLSFIIGCFIGYCRLSNDIQVNSYSRIRRDFLESWHFGKWVAAELVPYTMSVQGYIYLTALFIGTQATAALGASQSILNATSVLLLSFSNVMTPVAAKRYTSGGSRALAAFMTKAGVVSAVPILGFYFLTMLFAEDILNFVYNRNYAGYGWLLFICSLYFIISYFNRMIQIMLYAKKKPDIGFAAKSASFVVMAVTAYPLISYYGVFGAAVGTVISQVVILSGYLVYLIGTLKREINI
jgi:O-antigen/teichoic acid export membrane protein